ncbi:MAG: hypothetical protein KAT00_01440 [Planctomycetes bacterium]|nr:hypothetical protein [Planctomycetota bacterium]
MTQNETKEQVSETKRWTAIEELLDSIALDVQHRCYISKSRTGVRYVTSLVRRHLMRVEELLAEEEMYNKQPEITATLVIARQAIIEAVVNKDGLDVGQASIALDSIDRYLCKSGKPQ